MELIRSLDRPARIRGGCVATVGSFDGVHMGHQSVLGQVRQHAGELQCPSVVLTFEPQPREFFQGDGAPARLSTFREKFQLIAEQDIDILICLRFTEALAKVAADVFVEKLFMDAMGVRRIVIGDDFRFGRNREGDIQILRELGNKGGFDVVPINAYFIDGERVSSSRIRLALENSEFGLARKLLGRPYSISGRVRHGEKRGRQLGFPTANIELKRVTTPLLGVYAVYVHGPGEETHEGVVNIGTRPVFDGKKLLLEVHVLDYSNDIYGKHIAVEFVQRLRGEQKFSSVDELKNQIKTDIEHARKIFRQKKTTSDLEK